jgi:hypothetical protein
MAIYTEAQKGIKLRNNIMEIPLLPSGMIGYDFP